MNYRQVLVTGGLGLIGSHLVEEVVKMGIDVTILDNEFSGSQSNLSQVVGPGKIKFVFGDIADSKLIESLMKNADFCFHLAASLGVKRILEKPILSLHTNVQGSENVLSSAAVHDVPIFIASTSEVYGKNPNQPLREDSDRVLGSPLKIRWAYSEAKAIDESLAQMYCQEKGLNFIIGRFFNTVGPRQLGDYGMVLPRFAKAALKGQDLEVYGDGEQTRVFCHVKDAVKAILSLVDSPKALNNVFNIGGVGEVSINELAFRVIELTGTSSKVVHIPYSEAYSNGFEETFRRVPDIGKIRNLAGWEPRIDLNEIIRDVVNWHRAQN